MVRAKSFELVNDDGNTRARLGLSTSTNAPVSRMLLQAFADDENMDDLVNQGEEAPFMALFDREGFARACLLLFEDGPTLLFRRDNNIELLMKVGQDGPALSFHKEDGSALIVDIDEHGPSLRGCVIRPITHPSFPLSRESSHFPVCERRSGSGWILLSHTPSKYGKKGEDGEPLSTISLRVDKDGSSILTFQGKDGKTGLMVSLDKDSNPGIDVFDSNGKITKSLI